MNANKGGVWLKERNELSQLRRLLRKNRQALHRLAPVRGAQCCREKPQPR